ncbi:hypothetical protein [Myroides marinus]|uniref:hypothetical protein n=1 Tax=Myroides marinus TaxID=703342 RepID=UPI0025782E46|nr:hypothetical protein [Myroides marinus]MDM1373754.1 hypothetical protein [Myroides marinus]
MNNIDVNNKNYLYSVNNNTDVIKNEVFEDLDKIDLLGGNLKNILFYINEREKNVENKFNEENDRNSMYSFYATLRHSFVFWAPINEGGEGNFDKYMSEKNNNDSLSISIRGSINWWKVGGCDAVGATVGGIMGGPKGALVTGAGASIISIIMQW